jgi:hypothetical protein
MRLLRANHLTVKHDLVIGPARFEPLTAAENIRTGSGTKLTADEVRAICASAETPVPT